MTIAPPAPVRQLAPASDVPYRPRRILVAALKGGPGKTTTAVMLAFAYAARGERVAVVDADRFSQGASDWWTMLAEDNKGLSCPVTFHAWPGGPIDVYARQVERTSDATMVIIDTGGEDPNTFAAACRWASFLIAPCGPMTAELRRMPATFEVATATAERFNPELSAAVLLTRVPQPGRGQAVRAREDLAALDAPPVVLATEISRQGAYADAWGTVPADLGEYDQLVDELDGAGA